MENKEKHIMQEQFIFFGGLCVLFGIFYTLCMYDNLSGIGFLACIAGGILLSVMFLKKAGIPLKKDSVLYYLGILLLGISVCTTMNGFFQFFNRVGIILLFCAVMIHQIYDDKLWGFTIYVKRMVNFWFQCIGCMFHPFFHLAGYWRERKLSCESDTDENQILMEQELKKRKVRSVFRGITVAALFLLVVLPLLIQSDRIFAGFFDFSFDFQMINFLTFFRVMFRFCAGFFLTYMFYARLFKRNLTQYQESERKKRNALTGITFTLIITFFYVFYSGIQICYLFFRFGSGLPDGMTYSEYARSGFWQLLAVSIINIIMILMCMSVFEEHRILKILLLIISVCTCIMAISAAYRMVLYIQAYHLTFLRVLVLWFLGVLLLMMAGMMVSIFKKNFLLFRYIMVVVSCCYIAFSLARADCMIASYNIAHSEYVDYDDMSYMMYGLSADAAPYIADLEKEKRDVECYYSDEVKDYFTELKNKDISLRKWNLSGQRAKEAAERYFSEIMK